MRQIFAMLAPMALGLFIGKYHGQWIELATAYGKVAGFQIPAAVAARGPASVAPAAPSPESNVVSEDEKALALFSRMSAAKIRSVCETARELYATKAIANYARYIRDFSNYTEHDQWLRKRAAALAKEGQGWRGRGKIRVNDAEIELEVLITPPNPSAQAREASRLAADQECFAVQIYASREGELRQSESGRHCVSDLAYKYGNYFLTWAGASGALYHMDLAAVVISLPKSKVDTLTYMADGHDEWQNAESFTWTPVSVEEQSVRVAQLLNELNVTGR